MVSTKKRPATKELLEESIAPTPSQQYPSSKRPRRGTEANLGTTAPASASTTPATPSSVATRRPLLSDANYHLKFSYGINAWRLWVNHTSQPKSLAELVDVPDSELNTALTRFVREVRKPNNETYVADSIFYLCLGTIKFILLYYFVLLFLNRIIFVGRHSGIP